MVAVTRTFIETGLATDFETVPVSINIGSGLAGETLVILFGYEEADEVSTMTVDGNAFQRAIIAKHASLNTVEIWYGQAPAGTSALLTGTTSGGIGSLAEIDYAVYRLTGDSGTPVDSDGITNTAGSINLNTITIPVGGVGIWGWINDTATAASWLFANEDFDVPNAGSGNQFSGASIDQSGTPTVVADGANDDQALAGVAFATGSSSIFPFRNISELRHT